MGNIKSGKFRALAVARHTLALNVIIDSRLFDRSGFLRTRQAAILHASFCK